METTFFMTVPRNSTRFRVPFDVIATFEDRGDLSVATEGKMLPARRLSAGKRYRR